jgi:hypothetical protein
MMKIIAKDNFDRPHVADILIAENIHFRYVDIMVDALNASLASDHSEKYFMAVDDDYRLYRGMEELV